MRHASLTVRLTTALCVYVTMIGIMSFILIDDIIFINDIIITVFTKGTSFPHRPEPQPSAGRRLPLTGITTTPNAAYFEISVDSLQYSATLPSRPMDPLYESVGDFTLWKDRAKRGVQQLLKSLPRYAAPQANNKPPHLPPSHPSRSQSLPRGNVAPPTAKEAPPTAKDAPPDPEDSPMRNRPPAPLPEEARESDEDDDDYVYERVVNND